MEATLDIFHYAPRDIKPLLLLAIRPSDLSNTCKTNKEIRNICGSIDFLADYLKRWYDIEGDEKEYLEEIFFKIHPRKMMKICKDRPTFCSDEFIEQYQLTWEHSDAPGGKHSDIEKMFNDALKRRDLELLKDVSNLYKYNPFWRTPAISEDDDELFDKYVESGDREIFEIISKGRGTQEFFEQSIQRAQDYEDIGISIAIFKAAERGDEDFVRVLLEEKRIDPLVGQNSKAIIAAAEGRYGEIVKMLMGISSSDAKEVAVKQARKRGYKDIVDILEPKEVVKSPPKSSPDRLTKAAERYVEKLGEYHMEFRGEN